MGTFFIVVLMSCLLAISATAAIGEPPNNSTGKTFEELNALKPGLQVKTGGTRVRTGYHSAEELRLCENAENCEVFDDPRIGKAIRFIKGMEPGSAHYNATVLAGDRERAKSKNGTLAARGEGDESLFTVGLNVINWGNVQPQVVLNHMYDRCYAYSCSPQEIWYGTTAVRKLAWSDWATAPASYSLIAEVRGDWSEGYGMRNNFIKAIQQLSEKGQQWTNQIWAWGYNTGGGWASDSGSLWEIRQSDYFAISAWSGRDRRYMRGNMNVYIRTDWGETSDWGCGRAKDIVKDMISAMNGWAGAFFGIISNDFCG